MVRFKNRYVAVRVDPVDLSPQSDFKLNSTALYNSVLESVQKLHGDYGVAAIKVGLTAKYCNEMTRVAFLRVRHGSHKFVISGLPFIKHIARERVVIHTLYCGATLLQCCRFLKNYQRNELEKEWMLMGPSEKKKLEEKIMNVDFLEMKK